MILQHITDVLLYCEVISSLVIFAVYKGNDIARYVENERLFYIITVVGIVLHSVLFFLRYYHTTHVT